MLHLCSASRVRPLAAALAELLGEPLEDPMAPEWVAVPTVAMRRWLALELARSLGASGPGAGDGVAANIEFSFPGGLRHVVLEAGRAGEADPWHVDSLVWAVLDVLHARGDDDRLFPLTVLPEGATWFGRARRLADLFDRYAVRRPELMLQWAAGRDIDGTGRLLAEHDLWQPHLWRLVRACIGEPSPPERLPSLLEEVRSGALPLGLPQRLAIFGVTTLPSGRPFIELLEAVAARHELHLLLLDPSPRTTSRVREAALGRPLPLVLLRSEDGTDAEVRHVRHPLLRSWGRPYRERTVLLAAAEERGFPAPVPVEAADEAESVAPKTLLSRLQHDLRSGSAPTGDFELDPADRSIQVHSCHGQARQVQVLRDAILHLLEDDPTLKEEDIVILSPAIDQFAPLVEAGFGTSAGDSTDSSDLQAADTPGKALTPPPLRYRITDRSLRESYPVLAALDSLLALISGRFTVSEVLEFVSLPVVGRRFDFDEQALGTIADWVTKANVRWGLDGPHRAPWGLPAQFTANSWCAAIDRVLMGIAVSEDDIGLAPGDIAPLAVEGDDIAVAGRLADLLARLASFAEEMKVARPAAAWCEALSEAITQFFDVEDAQRWQLDQLRRVLAEVGDRAIVGDKPATVELSIADVRRLLADRLQGAPTRPDFFRGGITVSSLTPLRWLPFRVICLLGLDDAGTTGATAVDGDDLAALDPLVGDRDPRSEVRQALLEAILAAGDHLVITRTGRSIRTNREVPNTTVLAELRDTIRAMLSPQSRGDYRTRIETVHPCQPFDERNFERGALGVTGPWSFDPGALNGAKARRGQDVARPLFITGPLPAAPAAKTTIDLTELKSFFRHPVKAFLRQRLQLRLLGEESDLSDDLATSLDALEHWAVADRLLAARLAGHSTSEWQRRERALGTLPPGGLGELALHGIEETVEGLLARAAEIGVDPTGDERHPVDVVVRDIRLVETVMGRCKGPCPGPALLTSSKLGPKRRFSAWLDLVALVATDPATDWRSVVVGSAETSGGHDTIQLVGRGESPAERHLLALDALEIVVDCYRRGMLEPIPLFPTLSYKLHKHKAGPNDWRAWSGGGEGQDEANRLVFGDLSLSELQILRAREDDPLGRPAGRAERFADYLWDAVESSAEELP
ncbi:MAG: exodeoxyribonuclease V subunit gamma [Acidimicrobiales bacterium]